METPITKTNAHTLLTMLVRTFAMFGIVVTLMRVASEFAMFGPKVLGDWGVIWTLLTVAAPLAVMFALWLYADVVARWAHVRGAHTVFESNIDIGQWQHVAFSAIGVYVVVGALTDLIARIRMYTMMRTHSGDGGFRSDQLRDLAWSMFDCAGELALGIALMLGARGLVALLRRLRTAGQPTPPPAGDA